MAEICYVIRERDVRELIRGTLTTTRALEFLRERVDRHSYISARATRATADELLQLPRVRTEFGRSSFVFRASDTWNRLPTEVRGSAAESSGEFKSAVICYLSSR